MDFKLNWTVLSLMVLVSRVAGQCPSITDGSPFLKSGETCYIYVSTPYSWQDADSFCESQYGGASVQILNSNTITSLTNFTAGQAVNTVWTGARSMYTDWHWTDGSETGSYSNWALPNHIYHTQGVTCATISVQENNKWRQNVCQTGNYFICELDAASPNCVDTDSTEIARLNGRCYLAYSNSLQSWSTARDVCTDLGGDLAKVTSQPIQDAIETIVNTDISWHKYWIGLRQDTYYWSTGALVESFYWSDLQRGTDGACVELHREEGQQAEWFSEKCTKQRPVICQIDSDTSTRVTVSTQEPPTPTTTTKAPTLPPTQPKTTGKQTEATEPKATDSPVIAVTAESKGPSASVTAGLAVMVVIVFLILIGLLLFFLYYKRRNSLLKKAARAEAARLGAENGGERVNFDSHGMGDGDEAGPSHASDLFTTSHTTSSSETHEREKGRHTKYTTHHSDNRQDKPRFTPQTSVVEGGTPRNHKVVTPTHTPQPLDEHHGNNNNISGRKSMNQSRTSLKSDSEGGGTTSEAEEGGMRRGGGVRDSRSSDNGRSSKRRNIGVRRSNSKVRPADVPDSEPVRQEQSVYRADSLRGSHRRGNTQLPPLEKQTSLEDQQHQQQQQPTGGGRKKKHPRSSQRSHREGEEGEERRQQRRHRREGENSTARINGHESDGDLTSDRSNPGLANGESRLRPQELNGTGSYQNNGYYDGKTSPDYHQQDETESANEHRGRGNHAKRARKKNTKYSLESNNSQGDQYYVKNYENADSGRNGHHHHPGSESSRRHKKYETEQNGGGGEEVGGDYDHYEPSLALQTVNTVDIDCVSDVEVDSLPDDDENHITLDSFV